MSNQQRKQTLDDVWGVFLIIFIILFIADWLFYNGIVSPSKDHQFWYFIAMTLYKSQKVFLLFRVFYAISLVMFTWNMMSVKIGKNLTDHERIIYRTLFCIATPLMIAGYHSHFFVYDLMLYPIIFFAQLWISVRAINTFNKSQLKGDDVLGGISQKTSTYYFDWMTDKGKLTVHSPQQHIWVEGGPGSGKSQSIIKPIIYQAASRGYCGIVYDYEGDPREPGAPLLGRIAYTAAKNAKALNPNLKTNFSFINFTDMNKTVRVNPLSRRYIENQIDITDLIQNFMLNLSGNKKESGGDFWDKSAVAFIKAIAFHLWKNHYDKGLCTIPHLIAIAQDNIDAICRWVKQDDEVVLMMTSIISAWEKKAEGQLAGVLASAQLPLSVLLSPEIFWVLSKDEFDLDISRPDNAYLLCLGNSKKLQQALAPALSVIIGVILKQMNTPGRLESIFCFDEFPTVRVNGIDTFSSTVRKHKCSVILGSQDFTQASREYGKEYAEILRSNSGNMFVGMTRSLNTGKYLSDMLGDQKIENISYSTSQDNISTSESLQNQKVMQARDIMGQPVGNFTGAVAGGKPPYFSLQFDEFKFEEEDIPMFSHTIKTGDVTVDIEIHKRLVEDNYKQILKEARELLDPFRDIE